MSNATSFTMILGAIVIGSATPACAQQPPDMFGGMAGSIIRQMIEHRGRQGFVPPGRFDKSPQDGREYGQSRSPAQMADIQSKLDALGFDAGTPDGVAGEHTLQAIRQFQASIGAAQTGFLTDNELAVLLRRASAVGARTGASPVATAGPSFDCREARQASEGAICASPELAALDRQLAADYDAAVADPSKAGAVRAAQRQWIAERNNCGPVIACLVGVYRRRIAVLTATYVPAGSPGGAPSVVEFWRIARLHNARRLRPSFLRLPLGNERPKSPGNYDAVLSDSVRVRTTPVGRSPTMRTSSLHPQKCRTSEPAIRRRDIRDKDRLADDGCGEASSWHCAVCNRIASQPPGRYACGDASTRSHGSLWRRPIQRRCSGDVAWATVDRLSLADRPVRKRHRDSSWHCHRQADVRSRIGVLRRSCGSQAVAQHPGRSGSGLVLRAAVPDRRLAFKIRFRLHQAALRQPRSLQRLGRRQRVRAGGGVSLVPQLQVKPILLKMAPTVPIEIEMVKQVEVAPYDENTHSFPLRVERPNKSIYVRVSGAESKFNIDVEFDFPASVPVARDRAPAFLARVQPNGRKAYIAMHLELGRPTKDPNQGWPKMILTSKGSELSSTPICSGRCTASPRRHAPRSLFCRERLR